MTHTPTQPSIIYEHQGSWQMDVSRNHERNPVLIYNSPSETQSQEGWEFLTLPAQAQAAIQQKMYPCLGKTVRVRMSIIIEPIEPSENDASTDNS